MRPAAFIPLLILGCRSPEPPSPPSPAASDTSVVLPDLDLDGDGVGEADCDDTNPEVLPGAIEHCDGTDEDCDGLADNRCVGALDAVTWTPVWPGTAAQDQRYCGPGFERPADTEISCPQGVPAAVTLGPIDVSQWYAYRKHDAPAPDGVNLWSAETSRSTDWALTATLTIQSVDTQLHVRDGQSFGWLGLIFEDDPAPASGIRFFPDSGPRIDYRGPYAPGASGHRVRVGQPLSVRLVRHDRDLSLYVDEVYTGRATVPASDPSVDRHIRPTDPVFSRVQLGCVNCTATWSELALYAPAQPAQAPTAADCANRVRNGSFEAQQDDVPDHWGVAAPDAVDEVARAGVDLVASFQAISTPPGGTHGAHSVVLSPAAADGVVAELLQSFPLPPRSCPTCVDPLDVETCGADLFLGFDAKGLGPDARLTVQITGEEHLSEIEVDDGAGGCTAQAADVDLACTPALSEYVLDPSAFTRVEIPVRRCGFSDGPYPIQYGTVALSASGGDPVEIDALQIETGPSATPFCTRWEDEPLAAAPTAAFPPPLIVDTQPVMSLHRTADGVAAGEIQIGPSTDGLALTVTLDAPAAGDTLEVRVDPGGGARAPHWIRVDMSGSVLDAQGLDLQPTVSPDGLGFALPFDSLVTDASVGSTWSLQVVHWTEDPRLTAALAPDLAGPPGAPRSAHPLWWSSHPWTLPEPEEYQPAVVPAWADRAWSTVLAYPTHGPEQPQQLVDLGIGSISQINPYQTSIPLFAGANASLSQPRDIEAHTFHLHEVWRSDAEWDLFMTYANEIDASHAAWGQPLRWALMDEPKGSPLSKCRSDLGSGVADYGTVRSATETAMSGLGCGGATACDATQAYIACLEAIPLEINSLVTELRARLPPEVVIGLNLTPDGAVEWSDALHGLDYVSTTNNWAFTHRPRAWNPATLRMLQEDLPDTAIVGYNDILGPYENGPAERAADAVALRGLSWWFLAEGAIAIRHFVWPASTHALYPALAELEAELAALDGVVPGQRLDPPIPTSTPDLVARAFADGPATVVVVVNRTERTLSARADLTGLGTTGVSLDGGAPPQLEGPVLTAQMAPFEARVYRVD